MTTPSSHDPPKERYQVLEPIGSGGGGVVHKAYDTSLERIVAIKSLRSPDSGVPGPTASATTGESRTPEALREEARKLSALQHGNIVTVHDIGIDNGQPFVVMEYIDGETLDAAVSRGRWSLERMVALARPLLSALGAAHERHIMHRDIKPGNVMLVWQTDGSFRVKLLDFGLAKLSPQPSRQTIDNHDGVLGSLHFMAPEQFERGLLDRRTDLYALGCLLHYCLTAELPFDGDTPAEVMAAHLQHKIRRPLGKARPDLPDGIVRWVETLMQRHPKDRYHSAPQAAAVLDHLVGPASPTTSFATARPGDSVPAPPDTADKPATATDPTPRDRPNQTASMTSASRQKSLWNRVAVVALILGAIMVFATRQGFRPGGQAGTGSEPDQVAASDSTTPPEPVATLPAAPLAAYEPFVGQFLNVEGEVVSAGESRSGQTRYLNFASRPGIAISLAFRTSEVGDAFPLERLQAMEGRQIRASGQLIELHGNLHVFITDEDHLEILP